MGVHIVMDRNGDTRGPGQLIRTFDPTVEETLFIPHLQGG
jgi:hypothetical protein